MQTIGLTLVVAIAPTVMIATGALERLERHLLGPAPPCAASLESQPQRNSTHINSSRR